MRDRFPIVLLLHNNKCVATFGGSIPGQSAEAEMHARLSGANNGDTFSIIDLRFKEGEYDEHHRVESSLPKLVRIND
jgi:hypothetical protein